MPFLPKFIRSTHTVHVGGSRFLDYKPFDEARNPPGAIGEALQCFSSILIIGSLETASTFALFFLLLRSASCSEMRLTISNISSPGLKVES